MLSLLFKWDNADNDYFIRDIPVHELLRPHIIFSINHVNAFNIHTNMNQQKEKLLLNFSVLNQTATFQCNQYKFIWIH